MAPPQPIGRTWVYPFAGGWNQAQYQQTDQGVDLQNTDNNGVNPIYAADDGTVYVTKDTTAGGGFGPDYPILQLATSANTPQGKAISIYYGHTDATVKDGAKVKASDQIGTTANPSRGNASSYIGWLEIGYWGANGPMGNGAQMLADLSQKSLSPWGPSGVLPGGTGGSSNDPSSGSGNNNPDDVTSITAWNTAAGGDLPDPRNNLPFSPFFRGQVIGTDYTTGSFRYPLAAGPDMGTLISQPLYPATTSAQSFRVGRPVVNLVRGGMMEILQSRPGGPFACYFMINPESIAYANAINSSISPPSTTDPNTQVHSNWLMTSQSISFTLFFNRQYEVWTQSVPPTLVSPGPSAMGVRYDIRALERLLGMYDMANGTTGMSVNSPQQSVAQANPLQVSFGGPNSLQFQGRISEVDYTYTKFDSNMIPIEASIDVTMMRIINPPPNADMINTLVLPQNIPSVASGLLPAQVQFRNVGGTGGTPITQQGLPPLPSSS